MNRPITQRKRKDIRVLCIDGGGVRGRVPIQMLLALEKRIQEIDPSQSIRTCFDLICGTSTGGIIAFALVASDVTLNELDEMYCELPQKVFTSNWIDYLSYGVKQLPFFETPAFYPHAELETILHGYFGKKTLKDFFDEDDDEKGRTKPRGFVVSSNSTLSHPELYLFRTYKVDNPDPEGRARIHRIHGTSCDEDLDVTIVQALRATSAAPRYFEPQHLNGCDFVDGGLIANNPVEIAIAEAFQIYPNRVISTVVSLGTGSAKRREELHRSTLSWAQTSVRLATESERAAERARSNWEILRRVASNPMYAKWMTNCLELGTSDVDDKSTLKSVIPPDIPHDYILVDQDNEDFPQLYRLNTPTEDDLGAIDLDCTDPETLSNMVEKTKMYLRNHNDTILELAKRLTRSDSS